MQHQLDPLLPARSPIGQSLPVLSTMHDRRLTDRSFFEIELIFLRNHTKPCETTRNNNTIAIAQCDSAGFWVVQKGRSGGWNSDS
jgi:hypothetical protein